MLLVVAGVAVAALGLPAAGQAAGGYTVWSCRGPDGAPVSTQAWQRSGGADTTFSDTCATGGALNVTLPGALLSTTTDGGGYRFQGPPDGDVVDYSLWRAVDANGFLSGLFASVDETGSDGVGSAFETCSLTTLCPAPGAAADVLSNTFLRDHQNVDLRSISLDTGCSTLLGLCLNLGSDDVALDLYRSEVTIADASAPTAAGTPTGDLLDGPAGGTQTIVVPLADTGGGVQSATASVDGTQVATASVPGCTEPYTKPDPCPSFTSLALPIDTTSLSDGTHQLVVDAQDAAGNQATNVLDQPIQVDNTPDAPPTTTTTVTVPGPPPPTQTQTVTVPGPPPPSQTRTQTVPSPPPAPAGKGDYAVAVTQKKATAGAHGTVAGRVTQRGGAAQPGARVSVERRGYGPFGGDWTILQTLTANAAGAFSLPVPAAPEQLRFRLLPPRAATTSFLSGVVDVGSKERLTASATPRTLHNRQTLTIAGRILGVGAAARRKQVLVQSVVGHHWEVVDRIYAAANGTFRWHYRFERTTQEALYSFRIRVPADSDRWPWPSANSARLKVHVLP